MIENNGQMRSNKYKLGQIEVSILDSFPDPIVIVDQNRNVLAANFPARDQLLDLAWESNIFVEHRTVDVHIRRLRKALGDEANNGLIRTIRGVGYSFNQEEI